MPADRSTALIAQTEVDRARLGEVRERCGMAELAVFGSVARGDTRPDSDLDLLFVLPSGGYVGFSINRLEDDPAELFGRPADLVSKARCTALCVTRCRPRPESSKPRDRCLNR
jgi:predicted nucleotidyltransferase